MVFQVSDPVRVLRSIMRHGLRIGDQEVYAVQGETGIVLEEFESRQAGMLPEFTTQVKCLMWDDTVKTFKHTSLAIIRPPHIQRFMDEAVREREQRARTRNGINQARKRGARAARR